MDVEKISSVVVGAGVVGCAIAQKLAELGEAPFVLEAGPRIAEGVTSRNSGVVHAGLYYPPKSLKAWACIRGNRLLRDWCHKKSTPFQPTGKWVVAQKGEEDSLEEMLENARQSGALGLSRKSKAEIARDLPSVSAESAVYSASTGIVDPYLFSRSLLEDATSQGAELLVSCKVLGIEPISSGGYLLQTSRGPIAAERVFNAAGLYADEIARLAGIDAYRIYPWRGDYFRLTESFGLKTLIYPAKKKNAPGLGIHLTVDLDGSCKLGPDVEIVEEKDRFESREEKLDAFVAAAGRYLPGLKRDHLRYDSCGLRPKLRSATDAAERDFVVSEDLPGFFNFVGIESPGLTAAMALAERFVQPT